MTRSETKIYATLQLTELAGHPASDAVEPPLSAVQLLRSGTFEHGWYGKIQINDDLYDDLIRNFEERARGIDIALDIEHKPELGAAGWFRRLYTSEDGSELWGDVAWTPKGLELVRERIYKYLSIEYDLAYVDEEGALRGPTMLGAALTNRPFIKRMRSATLNFSENDFEEDDDAPESDGGETVVAFTDREQVLLSEIQRLREEKAKLRDEMRRLRIARTLDDAKRQGKITPAMEAWLIELAERDGGDSALERILTTLPARVRFEELGSAQSEEASDPAGALDEAIRVKMRKTEGLTYSEALAVIQREMPSLVTAYRQAARG